MHYSLYKTLLENAAINYKPTFLHRTAFDILFNIIFLLLKKLHKIKVTDLQVELQPIQYFSTYWKIFQVGKEHGIPTLAEKKLAISQTQKGPGWKGPLGYIR